jgi:outer membrane biosynthesis protein TonB
MGRTVAVVWHASFSLAAGVLYFFFVLPRWPELLGDTSHTLGTVLRIVTGALIGLAALPVVFTLLRTRRPEFGTPQLALTLRTSSIALHVLAGALIIGTAISEIWLSVDRAGQWLFGIYGAAAAVALLGMFAFYLAFVAELPPPPPKPLKAKKAKQGRRGRRKAAEDAGEEVPEADDEVPTEDETDESPESESESDEKPSEVTAEAEEAESTAEEPESTAKDEAADAGEPATTNGRQGNRRPSSKTTPRRRRRLRGGVAVED